MAGGARGACCGINSTDIRDDGGETAGPYCRKAPSSNHGSRSFTGWHCYSSAFVGKANAGRPCFGDSDGGTGAVRCPRVRTYPYDRHERLRMTLFGHS